MAKSKKVIYTVVTNGYDNIPVHKYIAPDWDYILFTDNKELIKKGRYKHWTVKPIIFNKLDNVRNSRYPKVNAHIVLPEYDYSLYLDGNIIVNNKNLFNLAEDLISKDVLLALPNHFERKCIYEEAEIVKNLKIDYPKIVNKEMRFLRHEKYPKNNGLMENNIIFRQHNKIKPALDLWWFMITKYSKRDQLSFMYALWKTGLKPTSIYTDKNGFGIHRKSPDFTFVYRETHNQDKIVDKSKFIPKFIGHIICCFIPIAKYRRKFKQKFVKD